MLTTTTSSEPPNFSNLPASASPPEGGGGGAGIREGIALITWVEIHLLMPGDWEDVPDGVKAQLSRLPSSAPIKTASKNCA